MGKIVSGLMLGAGVAIGGGVVLSQVEGDVNLRVPPVQEDWRDWRNWSPVTVESNTENPAIPESVVPSLPPEQLQALQAELQNGTSPRCPDNQPAYEYFLPDDPDNPLCLGTDGIVVEAGQLVFRVLVRPPNEHSIDIRASLDALPPNECTNALEAMANFAQALIQQTGVIQPNQTAPIAIEGGTTCTQNPAEQPAATESTTTAPPPPETAPPVTFEQIVPEGMDPEE